MLSQETLWSTFSIQFSALFLACLHRQANLLPSTVLELLQVPQISLYLRVRSNCLLVQENNVNFLCLNPMPFILAYQICQNKISQIVQLKQQKYVFSNSGSWKFEINSLISSELSPQLADGFLTVYPICPCLCFLCPNLFLKGYQSYCIREHLNDFDTFLMDQFSNTIML